MKIQNMLLPKPGVCAQNEMYVRLDEGIYLTDEHRSLTFAKYKCASFDTYFNGLSIEKWKKYTHVGQISITLQLKGSFEITLWSKEKIHDKIAEKEISVTRFDSKDADAVTLPFAGADLRGMYFARLQALSEGAQFLGGAYQAEVDPSQLNPIDLAIDICTFRREAFVKRNLEILQKNIWEAADNELAEHLQVFISDNGKTLDIPALSNARVHIVPNKNVGGAGGFTRGLIEIMHCNTYSASHALFMDDDIVIEPEALYRTYMLLRCAKAEYKEAFIGGAMLRLDQPNRQVEAGAAWNAGSQMARKYDLDLNRLEDCLHNEVEEYTEYNAWWYCCIPMSVVNEKNLPMPIFVRGDDIEYGLRNMKQLILMNGICVWHEPFENKYSSNVEYYVLRNMLYDNALHCPWYSKKQLIKYLWRKILQEIFFYRYKNVDLKIRAVEDYLKGVDFLKETDGEKLHQEIMAAGYKAQPLEELPMGFVYDTYERNLMPEKPKEIQKRKEKKLHKLVRFATFNGQFLRAKRDTIVSMANCYPVHFFRAKRVMHYDVTSKKAFITEKDLGKSMKCLWRLVRLLCKVWATYDSATEQFRNNASELMSEEFWRRYLEC
jgi:GT2 family glycosyltransferase